MASPTITVSKTLIIGLGTTGTQICDQIAARIRWEYGDLARVPWVRFLCLETNAIGRPANLPDADFQPLTISPNEYAGLTRFDSAYDEAIDLSKWADKKTLEAIPKKAVDDGVGNVRMIGRLAFFFKKNYDRVRNAVTARLNDLRELTGPAASEKLDALADGSTPTVVFAGQNTIRVFVVGTLCGGTCSGLAGDFGYFLQQVTRQEERVIGFFTLPHPDLSPASQKLAARFKKNAYTALVELNHYHLLTNVEKEEIPFPGHRFPTAQEQPYDLPFLSVPRTTSDSSRREVESAIADRIFLNAFVPATDPAADAINVSIMDREGHAHVFCAFGLATIEFPAQQVIDACSKMLALKAVREWKGRSLPDSQAATHLEEIGLTWPKIRRRLLNIDGNPLEKRLQDQLEIVLQAARTSEQDLARELNLLRAAFGGAGLISANTALAPNLVPQTVTNNAAYAAQQIYQDLQRYVQTRFLDYEEGPGRLRDLLDRAKSRLNDLTKQPPRDPQPEIQATDEAVQRVDQSRRKKLPWSRERVADPQMIQALKQALEQEIEARLDSETQRALQTTKTTDKTVSGVADRTRRLLEPVLERVDNLRNRLTAYQTHLEAEVRNLTQKAPEVNGVALFDADPNEGTVRKSYRECLEKEKADPTDDWDMVEQGEARRAIGAWTEVRDVLFPGNEPDWLQEFFLIGNGEPLPRTVAEAVERRAGAPFRRLRAVNVVERWDRWPGKESEIQRASGMLSTFLEVDEAQAMRGGRAPIPKRSIVLVPTTTNQEFNDQIRARAGIENFQDCPDPYRAVFIEEWYRFPLYGALAIVGGAGCLSNAQSSDFPTFYTRKDVFWTGLAEEEIKRTQEAEELVVVGVLLEKLRLQGGSLVMPWTPRYSGDDDVKRLPFSVRGAARALVFERAEVSEDGQKQPVEQELKRAMEILRDRIRQEREAARAVSGNGSDRVFVEKLHAANVSGDFNALPDFQDNKLAGKLLARFCARDPELFKAYSEVFPPDPALIARMRKRKGESRPIGGEYKDDGLYCPDETCCGLIGKDEADAARNGWRCFINPQKHDYSNQI